MNNQDNPAAYPYARIDPAWLKDTRGPMRPNGVTIHYTADVDEGRVVRALGRNGLKYHFIIGRDGQCHQHAPIDQMVWHAGKSEWNGQIPNRTHLGIALVSWGWLRARPEGCFVSWAGKVVDDHEVFHGQQGGAGLWHRVTDKQVATLDILCRWLIKSKGIRIANICGHDECAMPRGRKQDPGLIMGFDMNTYRNRLARYTKQG